MSAGPRGAPGLPAGTGTDRRCPGCQACVDGWAGAVSPPGRERWAPHADAVVSQKSAKGLFWVETGQSPPWMVLPPYAGLGCSISAPRVPLRLPEPAFSIWLGVVACPIAPRAGGSAGGRRSCVGDRTDGDGTGGSTRRCPEGAVSSGSGWYEGTGAPRARSRRSGQGWGRCTGAEERCGEPGCRVGRQSRGLGRDPSLCGGWGR